MVCRINSTVSYDYLIHRHLSPVLLSWKKKTVIETTICGVIKRIIIMTEERRNSCMGNYWSHVTWTLLWTVNIL